MGEILNRLIDWIKDASVSISKKAFFITLGIIALIGFNEYTGFIYYYSLAKEAEMLYHLEIAKKNGEENPQLIEYLNKQEQKIINREYIHEPLIKSIKSIKLPSFSSGSDTEENIPEKVEENNNVDRSTFWHLITSVGILLILAIMLCVMIIIMPFTSNIDKWKIWGGSFVLLIPILLLAWFFQYIWGLIPILGHVGVNYSIQSLFQVIGLIGLASLDSNKNKK